MSLAAIVIFLAAVIGWLGWCPLRRWRYRSFPGPFGLPFLGNLPQLVAMDGTRYLSYVAKTYGPVCKLWFGTRPWLVISDVDLVRQLAAQSSARPPDLDTYLHVLTGENRQVERAGILFANGEAWRRARRVFEASLIRPDSLAAHLPAIRRCLGRFVPSLERYGASGQPLDALSCLGDLMLAITGELAYGVDFEVDFEAAAAAAGKAAHQQGRQQQQQQRRQKHLDAGVADAARAGAASARVGPQLALACRDAFETLQLDRSTAYLPLQLAFPYLAPAIRWLAARLPDARQRRSMAARSALNAISRQLVAQWQADSAKQAGGRNTRSSAAAAGVEGLVTEGAERFDVEPSEGEGAAAAAAPQLREVGYGISGSSFLAAMLAGVSGPGAQERLSELEVVAQCVTFILAAFETTSTATAMALMLLASHPEAQARLAAEVDGTGGQDITMQLLGELPYMEAVLNESLRMYPPGTSLTRAAREDIRLPDGRVIPRGTVLALSNYNLHHDPALWPEPERFMPERFMASDGGEGDGGGGGGGSGLLGPSHPAAWAGFGLGARSCVGRKLAMMIVKATLVSLARRFTFTISPLQRLPPRMVTGVTYCPEGGVWLNVHPRGPSSPPP